MENRSSSSGKYSQNSQHLAEFMKEQPCDPEQLKSRIIFMSMFNDIFWGEKENEEKCKSNAHEVANYALRLPRGH